MLRDAVCFGPSIAFCKQDLSSGAALRRAVSTNGGAVHSAPSVDGQRKGPLKHRWSMGAWRRLRAHLARVLQIFSAFRRGA